MALALALRPQVFGFGLGLEGCGLDLGLGFEGCGLDLLLEGYGLGLGLGLGVSGPVNITGV